MMRGFGIINVEPLAQAMVSGQITPSFLPAQSFQPTYLPAGQTTTLPGWLYATPSFASQLAQLLGGSVVQGQPPGGYQVAPGSSLPATSFISVDGQQILPGNIFEPGTVLSFADLCTAENFLTNSIPGSAFGPSCASYAASTANPIITQSGVPAAQAPVVASNPVTTPVATPTPTPASAAIPPAASQVVTGTAGSSVGSAAASTAAANSDITIGGFDLSSIPWYVWAAIGGGVLLVATQGGKQ